MSRRDQIRLSDEELRELLEGERIAVVSSLGPRGWPHSMPLWYVPREDEVWVWTYAKSQKVRNLERDPRATVLVEAGRRYSELRGAMIESEAEIHRDFETVIGFAEESTVRYAEGIWVMSGEVAATAPERLADVEGWQRTGQVEGSRIPHVWISPEHARWVAEERTVLAELDDGAIIVEWAFKGSRYLVKQILKEAGDAAVLEPADVREDVLAAVERLLAPSAR